MYGKFHNIRMTGVASMIPTKVVENLDLINDSNEKMVKKQIRATGIKRKHYVSDNQTATDLCTGAASQLLHELNWNPEDIKVLIYVSSYTQFVIPSTAFYIQKKLGIGVDCNVFDMNLSCSGFVAGIETMGSLLQHCGEGGKGLLLVGVTPSMDADKAYEGTVPLFGDGGAAAAFEVKEGHTMYFSQYSDGSRIPALYKPDNTTPLHMEGMEVFNFTISDVADSINDFFAHYHLKREELDYCFLHQAQKFILNKLVDFCDLPEQKCPICYEEFGNTGAVSIPANMCYHADEIDFKKKNRLFLSGFGAGLSWGNLWMETEDLLVLPVIYSDEKLVKEDWEKEKEDVGESS